MSKKILVIEDEEHLGKAIKAFLEEHGFQVIFNSEGINDIADIRAIMPDLILTDLLLPRLHGFDICKSVKSDSQLMNTPLIIMTAVYTNAIHKLEAQRLGVKGFIEKPLNFDQLLARIRAELGEDIPAAPEPAPVRTAAPARPAPPPSTLPEEDSFGKDSGDDFIISDEPPQQTPTVQIKRPEPTILVDDREEEGEGAGGSRENEKDTAIRKHFRQLRDEYAAKLPGKIIDMENVWADILSGGDTKRQLAKLRRLVHSLAGSGTTFGFKDISELARELELTLDMIISEGDETIAQRKDKITELLDDMRRHPLIATELEIMRMKS